MTEQPAGRGGQSLAVSPGGRQPQAGYLSMRTGGWNGAGFRCSLRRHTGSDGTDLGDLVRPDHGAHLHLLARVSRRAPDVRCSNDAGSVRSAATWPGASSTAVFTCLARASTSRGDKPLTLRAIRQAPNRRSGAARHRRRTAAGIGGAAASGATGIDAAESCKQGPGPMPAVEG